MPNWSSNDLAVIEEALKQAMANGVDYQSILSFQEVLNKVKGNTNETNRTEALDGFRYDYDDSTNV